MSNAPRTTRAIEGLSDGPHTTQEEHAMLNPLSPPRPARIEENFVPRGIIPSRCGVCGHCHKPRIPVDGPDVCISWLLQDRADLLAALRGLETAISHHDPADPIDGCENCGKALAEARAAIRAAGGVS